MFCCDNLSRGTVNRIKRTKHEIYLVESGRHGIGVRSTVWHRLLQSRQWYVLIPMQFSAAI